MSISVPQQCAGVYCHALWDKCTIFATQVFRYDPTLRGMSTALGKIRSTQNVSVIYSVSIAYREVQSLVLMHRKLTP